MSSPQFQSSSASSAQPVVHENGDETSQLSTVTEIVSPQASQQLDTESPLFRSLLRLPAEQRRALADEIDVVVAHLQGLVEVVERYSDINATQINRIVGSFNPSIKFRDDQSVPSTQTQSEPDPDKTGDSDAEPPGNDVQSELDGTSN